MDPFRQLEIRRDRRTPLAVQLSRQLSWLITGGHLVGGTRLPSIRELADQLGINLHTVRAAYRHLEEDALVEVRHGAGAYVLPRNPGRKIDHLDASPTALYGVVVPMLSGFHRRMLDGAGLAAEAVAAMVTVVEARESVARGTRAAQALLDVGCAGIVVATPVVDPSRLIRREEGAPRLVVCDWPDGPTPRVDFDVEGGVREALTHLEGHGHRAIALVAPPPEWENIRPMHTAAAGHESRPTHIAVHDFTYEAGVRAAAELTEMHRPRPTAVVAGGEDLAVGLIAGLRDRGLEVPGDVAVIGIGDDSAPGRSSLTTVELPAHAMGREAIGLLTRDELDPEAHLVLETHLMVRTSCGCIDT